MNESKALRELQQGSERALELFIDKYNAYVSTVVYNIIGSEMAMGDIEECVSDVFYVLWKQAAKLEHSPIKAWLGTVARNTALKKLRDKGHCISLDEDIVALENHGPEQSYEMTEQRRLLRLCLEQMKPDDREIFYRFYFYCQSIKAISGQMKMKESTVKSRLLRGREKLKSIMLDGFEEGGL